MKKLTFIVLLVAVFCAVTRAQEDGFRPIVNPPRGKTLVETLKSAGNYKTLIIIIGKIGLEGFGLGKNSNEPITLFAPNDAAFAKMSKQQFEELMKDPTKMKNLLLLHTVRGRVMVADLLVPIGDGTSKTYKELKSLQGRVMGFQCNGHTGDHHPRYENGKGMIGKGDIAFDRGIVHEVDTVMASDYLFARSGGAPR